MFVFLCVLKPYQNENHLFSLTRRVRQSVNIAEKNEHENIICSAHVLTHLKQSASVNVRLHCRGVACFVMQVEIIIITRGRSQGRGIVIVSCLHGYNAGACG